VTGQMSTKCPAAMMLLTRQWLMDLLTWLRLKMVR